MATRSGPAPRGGREDGTRDAGVVPGVAASAVAGEPAVGAYLGPARRTPPPPGEEGAERDGDDEDDDEELREGAEWLVEGEELRGAE